MNKIIEKALNNITIKLDELVQELENSNLSDNDKRKQAHVYYIMFKFIKKEDFEHNLAVLNNDAVKRKFNLHELDL